MENVCFFAVFGMGPMELGILALVALLLFGSRLPGLMGNIGKGYAELRKGLRGVENELEEAAR